MIARVLLLGSAALALIAPHTRAQAPRASLVGWVRDSTGTPIINADVEIAASEAHGRTDSTGRFHIRMLDPGPTRITIRRLGFEPASFDFELHTAFEDSLAVTLEPSAAALDAVHTTAAEARRIQDLKGFYDRRKRGGGVFITRDEIEAHHTNVLAAVLQDASGVQIVHNRRGRTDIRFDASQIKSRDCAPDYWIDGQRVRDPHLDDFSATDIEAIELYSGPSTTPMRFSQTTSMTTCGTVVLWTRIPGEPPV